MNKKARNFRGFTLIEMIIAMALFSIIMLIAFKLYEPVSSIFRSTNIRERTYSYTNNIENIVQGQLDDADNVWIYTGRKSDAELADICDLFKENYYNDMVMGIDRTHQAGAIGRMRILHVLNNPYSGHGVDYPSGQIVLTDFEFDCAESSHISDTALGTAIGNSIALLPNAYFNNNGFRFSYCMGTGALVTADPPAGARAGDTYSRLDVDGDGDTTVPLNAQELSMSVVVTGNSDFVDVPAGYRAFENPCSLSSIGLSLSTLNSSFRGHQPRPIYYMDGTNVRNDIAHIPLTQSVLFNRDNLTDPVETFTDVPVSFNEDIYFIYTYEGEFHV